MNIKRLRNSSFYQGIHVVVNARTEDDIDVEDITKKVAKSSGSNYSFHKEKPKPVETPSAVVSVLIIYILYTYKCVLFLYTPSGKIDDVATAHQQLPLKT